jgi:ribosomal protein S18 acetylase RimI-like enzyme
MNPVLLYEELSRNALPSLQTQYYDGWILRFTNGYSYTNRANSVNMVYPSTLDPQIKIAECEKRYFSLGLPATFKITGEADAEIEELLERRGYTVITPTRVMTAAISDGPVSGDCELTRSIGEDWLDAYFTLSRYTDAKRHEIARLILNNITVPVVCGRLAKEGETVACGLCVTERGYAGLFNIVVEESQRGRGYGEELCRTLLSTAHRLGAHTAYLQVVKENNTAINLYSKLGFQVEYTYWYRTKQR